MKQCYHCHAGFADDYKAYRSSTCPDCGRDVKVCKNCNFYAPGMQHDCRESIQDPVKDKELSNFCDYFVFRNSNQTDPENSNNKADKARDSFNSLFG